jgi:hypothetical protein
MIDDGLMGCVSHTPWPAPAAALPPAAAPAEPVLGPLQKLVAIVRAFKPAYWQVGGTNNFCAQLCLLAVGRECMVARPAGFS